MDNNTTFGGLKWNTFEQYPEQTSNILLFCHHKRSGTRKYVRIINFNAVSFDFKKLRNNLTPKGSWDMYWLPLESVDISKLQ